MESIERKTVLFLKKSSFSEEVCQQVWPQGSRPPRLYELPKIHKPGVPLRPIVNTVGSPTYRLALHLALLLRGHTSHSPHHIKNSIGFVQVFSSLQVNNCDIMVSSDLVSLFTRVPIKETMYLLGRHFEEDVLGLFRHILSTSYFTFNWQFYGQTDGVAMGPPHTPVIGNFYMEDYEKVALELAPPKTLLLVSLRRRNLRHLAAWSWQTERLPTPPKEHPSFHSVHHVNRKWRPLPIPGLGYLQKTGWLSGAQSVPQAHSHPSLPQRHPINKRCYPLWYTEPELSVMKTACRLNWCE
jgi:hypothetical protein